jgi:hypothetical protein
MPLDPLISGVRAHASFLFDTQRHCGSGIIEC